MVDGRRQGLSVVHPTAADASECPLTWIMQPYTTAAVLGAGDRVEHGAETSLLRE